MGGQGLRRPLLATLEATGLSEKHSVGELSHSEPLLEHLFAKGKLEIVGAEHDLKSAKVEVL